MIVGESFRVLISTSRDMISRVGFYIFGLALLLSIHCEMFSSGTFPTSQGPFCDFDPPTQVDFKVLQGL